MVAGMQHMRLFACTPRARLKTSLAAIALSAVQKSGFEKATWSDSRLIKCHRSLRARAGVRRHHH
jgi:hypothetical protein